MLDVVLIYLPKPFLKKPEAQAPLGLMYIAASLEKAGKSVALKNYAGYTDEDAIADLPPSTLYGITVTSLEVPQSGRFTHKIREKFPDANVIIGGPGIYAFEAIDWKTINSVCYGDGENIIFDILKDAEKGAMRRVYTSDTITDLDSIPFPARHLLSNSLGGDIFAYNHNYYDGGSTVIISSRGCPYNCSFCSAPRLTHTNKLRFRKPKPVADEMRHVIDKYNIRQFRFSDDMFTTGKPRLIKMCEEIGKIDDIAWRVSCRVNPLDKEMLQAMKDAGCKELSFGIESFDDKVLDGLNKKATCKDNVKALELSHKLGFSTRVLFMIRTPFQTKETIKINKYWIERVPYSTVACTAFVPVPGCDIWYKPENYNIKILDRDLDKFNFYMFGPEGRRPIDPIIKIIGRPLDEFTKESEEFRDWIYSLGKVNEG